MCIFKSVLFLLISFIFVANFGTTSVTHKTISEPATQLEFDQCYFNYLQLSTRKSALVPTVCSSFVKSSGTEMEGEALGLLDQYK